MKLFDFKHICVLNVNMCTSFVLSLCKILLLFVCLCIILMRCGISGVSGDSLLVMLVCTVDSVQDILLNIVSCCRKCLTLHLTCGVMIKVHVFVL